MLKDKLKEYRTQCGLSQQTIAKLLMIHRSTYSYYELGKTEPSIENLCQLAKIFAVSLDDLLEVGTGGSHLFVRDDGADFEPVMRVGELSREERMLVMRYRLLTQVQRRDLLSVMLTADDLQDDDEDAE